MWKDIFFLSTRTTNMPLLAEWSQNYVMLYDTLQISKYHNRNTCQFIRTYSKGPLEHPKNYLGRFQAFCPLVIRHQYKHFVHRLINTLGFNDFQPKIKLTYQNFHSLASNLSTIYFQTSAGLQNFFSLQWALGCKELFVKLHTIMLNMPVEKAKLKWSGNKCK